MKLINPRRRKVLGTFVTCAIAGIAALAFAAWLTDGEGPGTSKGGQLQSPTVSPGTNNTEGMLPGQTGYGSFTVSNPNNVPLRVTAVQQPLTGGTSSAGVNCPASNVTVNSRSLNGTGPVVQANSTENINVADACRLAADAPTACQARRSRSGRG